MPRSLALALRGPGLVLTLFVLAMAGCSGRPAPDRVRLHASAVPSPARVAAQRPPVRLAVALLVSPQEGFQLYQDLADALARRIRRPVRLVLRRSFMEVNDLMRARQAELVAQCSEGFQRGRSGYGLEAIAVPRVRGRLRHPSVLIVRSDSPLRLPGDLAGRALAVADPLCAPESLPPGAGAPRPGAFPVRRLTIKSHDRAIRAVGEGLVDAALVDATVLLRLGAADHAMAAGLRAIWETGAYLNAPLAVHPSLDAGLRNQLQQALLGLHERYDGRSVLARFGADRFELPPAEAARSAGTRPARRGWRHGGQAASRRPGAPGGGE